jgi:hypothetical protein
MKIKEEIIHNAIKGVIGPKADKLADECKRLLEQILRERYPRRVQEWVNNAPAGGVIKQNNFALKIDGKNLMCKALSPMAIARLVKKTESPYCRHFVINFSLPKSYGALFTDYTNSMIEVPLKFISRARPLTKEAARLEGELETLVETLHTALAVVHTDKVLKTNYPELANYLPAQVIPNKQAIAISNQAMNKVLGKV